MIESEVDVLVIKYDINFMYNTQYLDYDSVILSAFKLLETVIYPW